MNKSKWKKITLNITDDYSIKNILYDKNRKLYRVIKKLIDKFLNNADLVALFLPNFLPVLRCLIILLYLMEANYQVQDQVIDL